MSMNDTHFYAGICLLDLQTFKHPSTRKQTNPSLTTQKSVELCILLLMGVSWGEPECVPGTEVLSSMMFLKIRGQIEVKATG